MTATWPRPVASLECSLVVAHQLREPTILEPLALRQQLAQDGFLYLRSFLPCELVTIARRTLALDLASNGFLDTSTCLDLTVDPLYINPESIKDKRTPELLNRTDLHRHPDVLSVLEHDSLRRLMRSLLITPSSDTVGFATPPSTICLPELRTHPYKWLRVVGPSLYTGLHVDRTYFPTSSFPTLLTAWIPLDNIPTELGSLVIAPDIHLPPMKAGGDGTKSGWILEKYLEDQTIRWESADMNRGDVVIIDPARCVHMSSRNVASPPTWRISADTRWWI
ncbi:BZ3500_MvSof-1268-A1-R1_Chr7-2g09521 [Microbotryum saponariae]|uniref:BZ3500_MvSof-1268-A1-R1_Chr7-2g09521 protein n=1 Tax=Microbotryum saponariae TaxID=289078 RepID=A0A2X0M0S7_9BASI|nr:BZ3501_MvSof-1269-A2-R1_Chr7-1g09221 [Microbotryum saponariae]SDA02625.1 BZ3500_MvSof-1268-A1-R1_Chr7-2g09521 [Microbotryum saponariae]